MPNTDSSKNGFDPSKQYQAQEEDIYYDDGREIGLLKFIFDKDNINDIRGSPAKVLAAIDEFAQTKKYLMNVGYEKGQKVVDLIAEVKPKVMVELGGYVGYSCILFADAFRKAGGERYLSLEKSPEFAGVIMVLVELAGLSDVVKVVVGGVNDSLERLHSEGALTRIDLMFLDHWKPGYTTDTKLCEELKLIGPGSVLAADNVVKPGNPPYLKYVRSTPREKREAARTKSSHENADFDHRTQYAKKSWEDKSTLDTPRTGNPYLIYKSEHVKGWEPSGVEDALEISRCVGESTDKEIDEETGAKAD